MKILTAEFVKTATRQDQYPPALFPEVAVAGRSNVGKSSLINVLLQRKHLVRTSNTPGRTQALNFFNVNDRLSFVDLPGYGYAKVPADIRSQWGPMVETYFRVRSVLKLVMLVLDSRREPTRDDLFLISWLNMYQRPWLPVLTKIDKLSRNDARKSMTRLCSLLALKDEAAPVAFSARSGEGRDVLWKEIQRSLELNFLEHV